MHHTNIQDEERESKKQYGEDEEAQSTIFLFFFPQRDWHSRSSVNEWMPWE